MAYYKETVTYGNFVDVKFYHTLRQYSDAPKERRPTFRETPPSQQEVNRRNAIEKLRNKKYVYDITDLISSVSWSGSKNQASRKLDISIASSPFDGNFDGFSPELGDILYFYPDGVKHASFLGKISSISQTAGPGTISVSANDFMTSLLKSNVTLRFKDKTPEYISKYILNYLGVSVGSLAKTGIKLKKMIFDNENAYNAIIKSYYKAAKKVKKKFMPYMNGIKFCIGESGKDCGITLKIGTNVISSSFEQSSEDIVNRVVVFDENGKNVGTFKEKDSENKFGIFQDTVSLSSGENAATAAQAAFRRPTKEAKVDAIGHISCIAGRTIRLFDATTGLTGKFFIENDTHTFSNGIHTMSLDLAFQNIMEGGDDKKKKKPEATDKSICWYSSNSKKYHSKSSCGKMKQPIKTTVREAVKTGRGKCSNCWE